MSLMCILGQHKFLLLQEHVYANLARDVDEIEVKRAMFDMGAYKAPAQMGGAPSFTSLNVT